MKPFAMRQQLPEEQEEGKGISTADTPSSWQYAVPLTLDACRCPHLQAYLPHVLNLECVRNSGTDTWRMSNPVHALHLASHTNPDGTTVPVSEDDCYAMYGDEERRTNAIHLGGIVDSFCPMVAPTSRKIYSRRKTQEKAPVKVLSIDAATPPKSDPQSGNSSKTIDDDGLDIKPENNNPFPGAINPEKQTAPVATTVGAIAKPLDMEVDSKETAAATAAPTSSDGAPAVPASVTLDLACSVNPSLAPSTSQQVIADEESIKVAATAESDLPRGDMDEEITEAGKTAQEPPESRSDVDTDQENGVAQQSEIKLADKIAQEPLKSQSSVKADQENIVANQSVVSISQSDQDINVEKSGEVAQAGTITQEPPGVAESKEAQVVSTRFEKRQKSNESQTEMSAAKGERSPDKTTSREMETDFKNPEQAPDRGSPKSMAISIPGQAITTETDMTPSRSSTDRMTSQTKETILGQANMSMVTGDSSPDIVTSHIIATGARSAGQVAESAASVPSSVDYGLPLSRYQHLRHIENRILKQRKVVTSKRKPKLEPVNKKKSSSGSTKKRKSSGTVKSGDTGPTTQGNSVSMRSSSLAGLGPEFGGGSHVLKIELGTKEQVYWEQDAMRARCKVEEWMEVLRLNRRTFWNEKLKNNKAKKKVDVLASNFGGLSSQFSLKQQCDLSHSKAAWGFNHVSSVGGCACATGDELLQCLECSFIGCAPCSTCPKSQQHIVQHLLQTRHTFAMSCGPRAELFCFRCGDFVYHEVFDQEKERIDVSQQLPWMGWKEHAVQRSFDPMKFVTTPDHGVVWRGLIATYPTLAPEEYVLSARLSRKRLMMFQGEIEGPSLTWGPKAVDFAAHQRLDHNAIWRVGCPIGLYNLGNTCFMSAVIQCLVHCVPLQRHFLSDVGHHHQSCQVLRHISTTQTSENASATDAGNAAGLDNSGGNDDVCLACEMDILFLRYFGNAIGKDVVGAVCEPLLSATPNKPDDPPKPDVSELKGEPLVISELLTAAWRSGGMDHLAGYEQRDAHEFLQAFLDIMGKHASQHRKRLRILLNTADPLSPKEIQRNESTIDDDVAKYLFEGVLRSVLICGECGCKRSLSEPFLNISLPLAKEMERSVPTEDRAGTAGGKRLSANKLNISVQQCLKHFTAPESLGDPVHCPSCRKKTPTKKQHTFAKLPRVLCLHLKRFDAANNKKIDDFVSFPAYGLDMGQHLPHWCEVMQGASAEKEEEADGAMSSPQILYDLFGTVNHNGCTNQGHYVSNVKVNGQWYHCNDAFVSGGGEKDVLKSDGAYVLFYIRR